jgi:hypothetical protein
MKRKALALFSAALVAVAGVAACDVYSWTKSTYKVHRQNAVDVPFLKTEVSDLRTEMDAMERYTNADTWRWKRQTNLNAYLQQQIDRKRSK